MIEFVNLANNLTYLLPYSNNYTESWSSVVLEGNYNISCNSIFKELFNIVAAIGFPGIINLKLDAITVDDCESELTDDYETWSIHINKTPLIERGMTTEGIINFFLKSSCCADWLSHLQHLNIENPLNKDKTIRILIADLNSPMGGEFIYFLPCRIEYLGYNEYSNSVKLPSQEKVKDNVLFLTPSSIFINPNRYFIDNLDADQQIADKMVTLAIKSLLPCFVNVYYNDGKVILDGISRHTLKLYDDKDVFEYNILLQFAKAVEWLYAEHAAIRKKLFSDRLTLEISDGKSLLSVLRDNIDFATTQAKDRYDFVILDRKDAYLKELKDLLKDLKSQSDLYALKIRNLLSNLLRDVLATIILIGFTTFTRINDLASIQGGSVIKYLFWGLGYYYIVSITFQVLTDIVDIRTSKSELLYWKTVSRELMSENEFNRHLKGSLNKRRIGLSILYPTIALLYILMSIICFNFPANFKENKQKSKTTNHNGRGLEYQNRQSDYSQNWQQITGRGDDTIKSGINDIR